ncbi:AhpC/TSA family protein [Litoribacter ruber]|uniref:TlpA disulfide reductase family protein n=1 Tax=Litoribacter ruber TaxID=702568 RepID=UPI001BD935B7|nr:TlpA disulfide reductase family protein [Litoribacter ruber]MBT0810686.1 AhpC/TSA family protein [Litoribacter ruber]
MSTFKNNVLLVAFVMLAFACSTDKEKSFDGEVLISGSFQNQPEGALILSQYKDNSKETIDSIAVGSDGKFEYTLSLDGPGFYDLNLMNRQNIRLALYNEDVKISHDFNSGEKPDISGSRDTDQLKKIDRLTEEYQEEVNQLNSQYYEAMNANNQERIKEIQEKAMGLEGRQSEKVKAAIQDMDGSFASLAAIGMINPRSDFQFLDSVVNDLDQRYPNTRMITTLKSQLDDMRALSIGQPAPEISLPNPEGQTVNLSDLRGNYVLIDFWAAWCKPCREENPNVVRLYNKYNEKGFEVFGVSLDRTREAWLRGIKEDGLPWTQVSDLQYFNSEAASLYQINAIPATYLIDPDGNIIAKDLRGPSLENKLSELFD